MGKTLWRYLLLLVPCLLLNGCDMKVPSPKNPEIRVPHEQAMAEADALAKAKEFEARAATARFKLAAKRIESQGELDIAELVASHDEFVEKTLAEATSLREATRIAIEQSQARQGAWIDGISQVSTIAQSTGIPGVATIGGLLAGIVGLYSANRNKVIARTESERADAEAKKAAANRDIASRIVDSIEALKLIDPSVKASFKANGKEIDSWAGPQAVQFVNQVQSNALI
jgi:hypothetical protein